MGTSKKLVIQIRSGIHTNKFICEKFTEKDGILRLTNRVNGSEVIVAIFKDWAYAKEIDESKIID